MTVIESLKTYLENLLPGITVDLDFSSGNVNTAGIFSNPNDEYTARYIDGSYTRREYKTLFLSLSTTTDKKRKENAQTLEELTETIESAAQNGDLPAMEQGKQCLGLEVTGSAYIEVSDDGGSTAGYALSIAIDYLKEN